MKKSIHFTIHGDAMERFYRDDIRDLNSVAASFNRPSYISEADLIQALKLLHEHIKDNNLVDAYHQKQIMVVDVTYHKDDTKSWTLADHDTLGYKEALIANVGKYCLAKSYSSRKFAKTTRGDIARAILRADYAEIEDLKYELKRYECQSYGKCKALEKEYKYYDDFMVEFEQTSHKDSNKAWTLTLSEYIDLNTGKIIQDIFADIKADGQISSLELNAARHLFYYALPHFYAENEQDTVDVDDLLNYIDDNHNMAQAYNIYDHHVSVKLRNLISLVLRSHLVQKRFKVA